MKTLLKSKVSNMSDKDILDTLNQYNTNDVANWGDNIERLIYDEAKKRNLI
jgi:hypothetical protein